jgi:thiol-disulfide isomerase/thioredoxin
MDKKRYIIITGIVAAAVAVALTILFYTILANDRPVISSLEAERDIVILGESCQIVCNATDPDSDELSYGWSADEGEIRGQGAVIDWIAPGSVGSYNITVIVMDSRGSAVTGHTTITVQQQKAPDFTLATLTGTIITMSELQGAPVVLTFWATWCPYCQRQVSYIEDVAQQIKGEIKTIAIDIGEDISTVQDFFGSEPTMIVALDGSKGTFVDYCETYKNTKHSIPFTLFVDSESVVKYIKLGAFANETALWDALHSVFGTTIP